MKFSENDTIYCILSYHRVLVKALAECAFAKTLKRSLFMSLEKVSNIIF